MSHDPIRLALIVGSTREGRFGAMVATWLTMQAQRRPDVVLDVIDLVDVELPAHYPTELGPELQTYIERIGQADAFVVVTPEYNHGYPASLKQAIDLPRSEWERKPVGFVSYGGMAGGVRAVEQLRQVFAELHAVGMHDTVSFHNAWGRFDPSGGLRDPEDANVAAETMLDQLSWWGLALRSARRSDEAGLQESA